jgi:hypothetical protein
MENDERHKSPVVTCQLGFELAYGVDAHLSCYTLRRPLSAECYLVAIYRSGTAVRVEADTLLQPKRPDHRERLGRNYQDAGTRCK